MTPKRSITLMAWMALAIVWPLKSGWTHPVSVTSGMVEIREDRAVLEIEVLAEDLVMFYDMETDSGMMYEGAGLREKAEAHAAFLTKYFHVLDENGEALPARFADRDFSELPAAGLYYDELMSHWMTYRVEYPFEGRPDLLTLMQDFGGESPAVPSEVTLQVFHKGVRIESLMLEHGEFQAIDLDWNRDWGAIADDPAALREAYAERREELLGITASMNLYSFAYLERGGLRHEVLLPLNRLDQWFPLERAGQGRLSVAEQERLREPIAAFLAEQNHVTLDGREVAPVIQRLTFYGAKPSDYGAKPPEQAVPMIGGRLGVVYYFPAPSPPREVKFTWKMFDGLPSFETRFYAFDDGEAETHEMRSWENSFTWEGDPASGGVGAAAQVPPPPAARVARIPVAGLALGGCGLLVLLAGLPTRRRKSFAAAGLVLLGLSPLVWEAGRLEVARGVPPEGLPGEEAATEIFSALQGNIYRSFEQREEAAIYDSLADSVSGDLLEDFYLEVIRGLRMEDLGGGVSRVEAIDLLETEMESVEDAPVAAFELTATWNVAGTLEHWGHIHSRTNRYRARFRIEGLEQGWRITEFKPLNQERVSLKVRVRG